MKLRIALLGLASLFVIASCGDPPKVETLDSQYSPIYFKVETRARTGSVRVYALVKDENASPQLVIEGRDVAVKSVIWNKRNEAEFCMSKGKFSIQRPCEPQDRRQGRDSHEPSAGSVLTAPAINGVEASPICPCRPMRAGLRSVA